MNENESYSNFINFTYKSKENKDYVKIISDFCEMQKNKISNVEFMLRVLFGKFKI